MRCSLVSGKVTSPVRQSTFYLIQNLGTLLQQCRRELHILIETPAGGGALGRDISRQRRERCFVPQQELSSMNFLAASAFEERTQSTSVGVKPMTRCRSNCTGDIATEFVLTTSPPPPPPPINFHHALFDLPYTALKRREKLLTINY